MSAATTTSTSDTAVPEYQRPQQDDYSRSQRSRFRFKSRPRSASYDDASASAPHRSKRHKSSHPNGGDHSSSHHHHRHHRHHSRKHRTRPATNGEEREEGGGPTDDPSLYDDTYLPNTTSQNYTMDADTAFRESLFDALADDEGAAFWEGIYGQPIHTYPSTRPSGGGGRDGDGGPRGELEQMTDEEYTSYVRARMYEKTHQHILEERAAREEARARQREARKTTEKMEREREAWQGMVEGSLRRGEERRLRKKWKEIWSAYLSAWEDGREQETQESKATSTSTKTTSTNGDDDIDVKDKIPHWPVQSGRRRDVTHETVEEFLRHAPSEEASSLKNNNTTTPTPSSLARVLKAERIRWHPDKIQQRFGGRENLSEPLMKSVTAVFQVVDRLWGELRAKEGAGRGE